VNVTGLDNNHPTTTANIELTIKRQSQNSILSSIENTGSNDKRASFDNSKKSSLSIRTDTTITNDRYQQKSELNKDEIRKKNGYIHSFRQQQLSSMTTTAAFAQQQSTISIRSGRKSDDDNTVSNIL
jgi:hypothetical protein